MIATEPDRTGVTPVQCPVRAPNCNPFAERFVRSAKSECLDRMILFGECSLRRVLNEYIARHHTKEITRALVTVCLIYFIYSKGSMVDPIQHRERLGGILNIYYREAA